MPCLNTWLLSRSNIRLRPPHHCPQRLTWNSRYLDRRTREGFAWRMDMETNSCPYGRYRGNYFLFFLMSLRGQLSHITMRLPFLFFCRFTFFVWTHPNIFPGPQSNGTHMTLWEQFFYLSTIYNVIPTFFFPTWKHQGKSSTTQALNQEVRNQTIGLKNNDSLG